MNSASFLADAVNQIQDDPESVAVVIIETPTGGQDSDLENEDYVISNRTGLPEETAGEVEVFNIRYDIERMTSDGEDSNVEPPPAKRQIKC